MSCPGRVPPDHEVDHAFPRTSSGPQDPGRGRDAQDQLPRTQDEVCPSRTRTTPSPGHVTAVTQQPATDLAALSLAQQQDKDLLQFVSSYAGHKWTFGKVALPDSPSSVLCELSRPAPRPLVPLHLRRPIALQLHGLAHPGVKSSVRLVSDRFFWPDLAKDVRTWTSSCVPCQRVKIHRHIRVPVKFFAIPDARFAHLHIDLVGPLPYSRGCTHLLTMVARGGSSDRHLHSVHLCSAAVQLGCPVWRTLPADQ